MNSIFRFYKIVNRETGFIWYYLEIVKFRSIKKEIKIGIYSIFFLFIKKTLKKKSNYIYFREILNVKILFLIQYSNI